MRVLIILSAMVVFSAAVADELQTDRQKFIGTWTLDYWRATEPENPDPEETWPHFWQEGNVIGTVTYTPIGTMTVHISKRQRNCFESGNFTAGTIEEKSIGFNEYLAYTGRYKLIRENGVKKVQHDVSQSLFPNWQSSQQKRVYEFTRERNDEGFHVDRLYLRTPPLGLKKHSLRWTRLTDPQQLELMECEPEN